MKKLTLYFLNILFSLYSLLIKFLSRIYIPKVSRNLIYKIVSKYILKINTINNYKKFKNINELFIRKIKLGKIDETSNLVYPCEGKIILNSLNENLQQTKIKQGIYSFSTMIQNKELEKKYEAGSYIIIHLAPNNYHRFHAPCSGKINYKKHIKGKNFPVNPFFRIPYVHALNERLIVEISNTLIIFIGACGVSEIVFNKKLNEEIIIGNELGYFALGSSIVLIDRTNIFNNTKYKNKKIKPLETIY